MTELKIKQADINNNGNQRLMGEIGGRGEFQNMYHVQLWVCASTWERVEGGHTVLGVFLLWKSMKYEIWM